MFPIMNLLESTFFQGFFSYRKLDKEHVSIYGPWNIYVFFFYIISFVFTVFFSF